MTRTAALLLAVSLASSEALAQAPGKPALDQQGDQLPRHARARLGSVRFRQGTPIATVEFAADGKTLVTMTGEGTFYLWRLPHGKDPVRFARGPAALSPDLSYAIVYNNNGLIELWDVKSDKLVRAVGAEMAGLARAQFAPSGRILAAVGSDGGLDTQAILSDVATGRELSRLLPPAPRQGQLPFILNSVCYSPDGKYLLGIGITGRFRDHCLWDTKTGRLLTFPAGWSDLVTEPSFTPDSKYLVERAQPTLPALPNQEGTARIRLWDPATGKHVRDIGEPIPPNVNPVFSPTGKHLAVVGPNAQKVHVYRVSDGKELPGAEIEPQTTIAGVAFSPDGKTMAVGCWDGTIRLHALASGKQVRRLKGFDIVRNVLGGVPVTSFDNSLAFSADGKMLAAAAGVMVRLWDVATGESLVAADDAHDDAILAVASTPDGKRIATLGADNTVRLWDNATGRHLRFVPGPPPAGDEITPPLAIGDPLSALSAALAFAPDGKTLAIAWPTHVLQVCDATTGKELRRIKGPEQGISALAFTPDGRMLISCGADGNVIGWDSATGKKVRPFVENALDNPMLMPNAGFGGLTRMALSPDGKTLATAVGDAEGYHLRLFEIMTGKERRHFRIKSEQGPLPGMMGRLGGLGGFPGPGLPSIFGLAFTPDGRGLAWSHGETIHLWDVRRGEELRRFGIRPGMLVRFGFSPDGKLLAGAADDGTVHLWETATGTVLGQLRGHRGPLTALAFGRDGRTLISGGSDTNALLWDVPEFLAARRVPASRLAEKDVALLWKALGETDGDAAYTAEQKLAEDPARVVPWLRERLKPIAPVNARDVARWVADLEANEFAVRRTAADQLEKLGKLAGPALRRRIAENPPLDLKQRIEQLLDLIDAPVTAPEVLRIQRAITVLEQIGTPEAQDVLRTLAQGAPEAALTQDAKLALERLGQK